jgi:diguanylate cyclase (GGDEF)-like protein
LRSAIEALRCRHRLILISPAYPAARIGRSRFPEYTLDRSKTGTILASKPFGSSQNEATVTPVSLDSLSILASLGQAAFVWDIATDAMLWSDGAAEIFPEIPPASFRSGAEFAKLIDSERSIRSEALGQSAPAGQGASARYRIEYGIRLSASDALLWIEESGCWFAGADGKPVRVQGIVRIDNQRHARDQQLLKQSRHDPLTGELNRAHLVAALAETVEEAARFHDPCVFMLIGIDHLARINDAFGFDVADGVILEVARRVRARMRGSDSLGRFSGNKFGLILKNCTVDAMNAAVERFLRGVRDDVIPTRPRNARFGQATPRRVILAVASECRARCPAPRQYPRHRRDRHRAQ